MSKVNDTIIDFAKIKAGSREITDYHLLFGYAQLLSLNKNVSDRLFPNEDNRRELEMIRGVVRENDLDMDMMMKGLTLLLSLKLKNPENGSVSSGGEDLAQIPADELLKKLLEANSAITSTFKNGCTLTDAINLKNQLAEEISQETPARPEEEKPAVPAQTETQSGSEGEMEALRESVQKKGSLEELTLKAKDLYYSLRKVVIGQDDAIDTFIRGYFKSEMFSDVRKEIRTPRAVFLFAGPPGVGKTLLATQAARILGRPCLKLNMSEYSDPQSAANLIGVSQKFAQASEGKLTSYVAANPNAVIIFDEFEKAHLNVMQLFLQILEGGLEDSKTEKTVSFRDTMLIFTTNAGKALYEDNRGKNLSHLDPNVILDALEKEEHPRIPMPLFPAAICSRFSAGNVIMFNYLGAGHLQSLVKMRLDECALLLEKKCGWKVSYDEKLAPMFLFHQGANLDARIIDSQSFQFIQDEIYEYTRQVSEKVHLENLEKVEFRVCLDNAGDEIRTMFVHDRKPEFVLFGDTDPESPGYREIGGDAIVYRADSLQSLKEILTKKDVSFVVIDPDYGELPQGVGAISLDDIRTAGIEAFHYIRKEMPDTSLYLLDVDQRMRGIDRITFMKQGASGFFRYQTSDPKMIEEELRELLSNDYLQERIKDLSGKGRHLAFNTAQRLSEDEKTAVIEFYDFHLYTAINSNDRSIVMDTAEKPDVSFKDIVGAENAKDELRFFVEFLKSPKKYILNGRRPPRGILLYGPPGTGKTMLAKAMAGEADATFLAVNATDFMDKWLGGGEEKIRSLFSAARRYAPSIIFIDEIDAIAKERGSSINNNVEPYLNTLMTEMDGFKFDPKRPVFVIAATNYALDKSKAGRGGVVIDPALVRRFDNKILVDLPNKEERKEYLTRLLSKVEDHQVHDSTVKNIADRSTGESLANLQNIFNLALRNAQKKGEPLGDTILLDSMEEYYYGEKHQWKKEYYVDVAHHEAGHAYMQYLSGKTPAFLTIVSRGNFGGYMAPGENEESPMYTREDLLWEIRTALAGRASEIVFFGEEKGVNTGVSSDLQMATQVALNMLCRYGMGDGSLLSVNASDVMTSPFSELLMKQAEDILQTEMKNAIRLIEEGKEKVTLLSDALLDKNQLVADEIKEILEKDPSQA